jgi:integrase
MDLSDAALPGLRLRLTAAGSRTWVLACRDMLGRMRRFTLGDYPTMGIADAREAARGMRAEVRKGADPVAESKRLRAIGRQARDGIGTLSALLDLYTREKGERLKSWAECRRRIDSVFSPFLNRPVATLKAADLQLQADGWKAKQSAAAAVRYLRPVLKWAVRRGYCSADLAHLAPPATVRRRRRVLTRDELTALLPILRTSSRPYAAALRFMLLTLTRRQETALARWRHVNMEARTWSILETKNGEPHVVPLSRQAIELLRSRLSADDSGNPKQPEASALIFATSTGAQLSNWDRETKALQDASGTSGWTRHDLRRTGATMLGEMGELPDIVEAALNHVSIRSPLAATYNRSRYRPQVAAALQRLADALDGIEDRAPEVVPLHAPNACRQR